MNGDNVEIRATLKRATGRPARDPGDKPVFEVLFRAEVNPTTTRLMAKLGKDATVGIAFDPDPQRTMPGFADDDNANAAPDRETTVDKDSTVVDTKTVIPSAGRRRNGTRSSEQVAPGDLPDPTKEPTPLRTSEPATV